MRKNLKLILVMIVTTLIMAISSVLIYSNVSQPKFYEKSISLGNKYLKEENYEEAILSFNKAITIEEKSTEARVLVAKSYIGNNEQDKAINSLKDAQQIDLKNEKLLLEILEILKEIDLEIAYDFLNNYINSVGKDSISQIIKDLESSSKETPSLPIASLEPGTYCTPISIKLTMEEIKLGHVIYYTIDGSEPTKECLKYNGKIDINSDTEIKIISCNKSGEVTEVISLVYKIDENLKTKVDELIKESEELLNETEEGANPGNCIEGSKKSFSLAINDAKKSLDKKILSKNDIDSISNKLSEAMSKFKDSIIEKTDKSKLNNKISEAQKIYNDSTEGSKDGQYKVGSKNKLQGAINNAQNVCDDILARQKDVDNASYTLNQAISTFKNSKVSSFTKEKARQYLIQKYGKEIDKKNDVWELGYYYSEEIAYSKYKITSDLKSDSNGRYYEAVHELNYMGDSFIMSCDLRVYENGNIVVLGH
ncbi:MAG: chitobiase/beta-hexosaminidase C-terminal domain-containing protein [Peptostreptococcaceae bacterium]